MAAGAGDGREAPAARGARSGRSRSGRSRTGRSRTGRSRAGAARGRAGLSGSSARVRAGLAALLRGSAGLPAASAARRVARLGRSGSGLAARAGRVRARGSAGLPAASAARRAARLGRSLSPLGALRSGRGRLGLPGLAESGLLGPEGVRGGRMQVLWALARGLSSGRCRVRGSNIAGVVKLVDAPDSKSGSARSVGSSPTARTIQIVACGPGGKPGPQDFRQLVVGGGYAQLPEPVQRCSVPCSSMAKRCSH